MKGIILAGGSGTRLHPITRAVSKQLLPVYDKPMIYYPLSTLMLAGIREILIITTPHDQEQFVRLLGDGIQLGLSLSYAVQPEPDGLAQAFIIGARAHRRRHRRAGARRQHLLRPRRSARPLPDGRDTGRPAACCSATRSRDPERYGVAEVDADGRLISIEEKPAQPRSRTAPSPACTSTTTTSSDIAAQLRPSARGELEITDLNNVYVAPRHRAAGRPRPRAWPGSTPARTTPCWRRASSCRCSSTGRACASPASRRSPFGRASSTPTQAYRLGAALAKSGYGEYVMSLAKSYAAADR